MKKLLTLTFWIASVAIYAQGNPLAIFENIASKTWKAEGKWGDGSDFKQEITVKYTLDSNLVLVSAIGFVDQKQSKMGLRNHGVRQFDKNANEVRFWEFDVFGGLTEGKVFAEGKSIVYQYPYGNGTVTDKWEYVDDNTYNFIVGDYQEGEWKQVYLKTQFKQIK